MNETDPLLTRHNSASNSLFLRSHDSEASNNADDGIQTSRGNKRALVCLFLLCGVFISVTQVKYTVTAKISAFSNVFNSVTMIVGIVVVILLHVTNMKSTSIIKSPKSTDLNFKYLIQNHITLIPIVILYALGLIMDYFEIIAGVSCRNTWRRCGDALMWIHESGLAHKILSIIFMGSVTLFCQNFYKMRFVNSGRCVRFGLVVLVSLNVSLWFKYLSREVADRLEKDVVNLTHFCVSDFNESRANDCLRRETREYSSSKNARNYLYPIKIEYFILVCEFLIATFWNRDSKQEKSLVATIDSNSHISDDDNSTTTATTNHDEEKKTRSLLRRYIFTALTTIIFPASSVLFCALAYFDSKLLNNREPPQDGELFCVYSILYCAAMSIAVIGCVVCSRNFRKIQRKVTGFEKLVMLSAVSIVIGVIFNIYAVVQLMKCDYWSHANNTCKNLAENHEKNHLALDPALYIISDVFDLVQVFVQIPFIAYCQKVLKPTRPELQHYRRMYETMLVFLIMSNFANWVVNSVLFSGVTPTYVYYDSVVSVWVIDLASPFKVFFRFSCTILFLQVFLRETVRSNSNNMN